MKIHERMKLGELKSFDLFHRTSFVRELEMEADTAIRSPGYPIQFWRDVSLYGVREAIAYVRNGEHGDAVKLEAAWKRIMAAMAATK